MTSDYVPTSPEIQSICNKSFRIASSKTMTNQGRLLHICNINLLEEAKKFIKNPADYNRAEKTISHLQKLVEQI